MNISRRRKPTVKIRRKSKSVRRKSKPVRRKSKSVRRKSKPVRRKSLTRKSYNVKDLSVSNKLNIAIIGEGPIGLCVATYLLYLVSKGLNAEITLYIKRAFFERNQLLQISTYIIETLEYIMHDTSFHKEKTITNVQVKCIEYILYNKLLSSSLIFKGEWSKDKNMNKYDHIFCADGYHSTSRKHFFGHVKQLVTRFRSPVFMIFSDIIDCDHLPKSNIFKLKDLEKEIGRGDYEDEAINNISALISFAYNFHKYNNSFPNKPFTEEVDHWASGFSNLAEYVSLFENTIKYIKSNKDNMEPIYKILDSKEAQVSVEMITLCRNTQKLNKTLRNLIKFLGPKINANEKFLAHFVKPTSCPQGIQLDKDELQYCKKYNNSNVWLIGDSANAYPPGHSIELGIIDVFNLLNIIFKDTSIEQHCIYLPQERYPHRLVSCKTGQISWNNCSEMDEFTFVNGYPEGDSRNITRSFKELKKELEKYIYSVCTLSKNSIDEYNRYQFKSYFNNLFNITCDSKHSLQ